MPSISTRVAEQVIRRGAQAALRRRGTLHVEGASNVPASGGVIIAARHFHNLYDGASLLVSVDRPLSILVAADWVPAGMRRSAFEKLCAMASWPVVMRALPDGGDDAEASNERARLPYARRALVQSVDLLRAGRALLIFPEGYPNIDPHGSVRSERPTDFGSFSPGVAHIALAAGRGRSPVPVVPAGLAYRGSDASGWDVTLRFGPPRWIERRADLPTWMEALSTTVRELST